MSKARPPRKPAATTRRKEARPRPKAVLASGPAAVVAATVPAHAASGRRGPDFNLASGEGAGFLAMLAGAAGLRLWGLAKNGFGNQYYAAAVRSMLESWHNFFFVSFDPAGWVTVDKPPLALWIQAASARAFGFSALSILAPQAAEGVLGVALLYFLVRRSFGAAAALLAGLLLATMPISVAVDRYNNVDACLVLVLILAAWAFTFAAENGRRSWLLAAAALAGLGFNAKMLAGFIGLPSFYFLYLLSAPGSFGHRAKELLLASLVLAVVALSWIAAVDFTPADQRPYIGSTKGNSMLELALGWNGLQRLSRGRGRRGQEAGPQAPTPQTAASGTHAEPAAAGTTAAPATASIAAGPGPAGQPELGGPGLGGQRRMGGRGGGFMGSGAPGLTRLAQPEMAGQMFWFLPLALLGLAAAWRLTRLQGEAEASLRGTASLVQALGHPGAVWARARAAVQGRPARQALLLWSGWLGMHFLVFSFAGVVHVYYLVLLAPAMAALPTIGMVALWREYCGGRRDLLPLTLLLNALWQVSILLAYPDWSPAFLPLLAGGSLLAALLLALANLRAASGPGISLARVGAAAGLVALLACPLAWALTPVLGPEGGGSVQADPALVTGASNDGGRWGGGRGAQNTLAGSRRLLDFLVTHRQGARYLVASQNSQAVSPLIIASGEPAIAIGGFMGGDPIVTADQLAEKIRGGEIRYFLLGSQRRGPWTMQEGPTEQNAAGGASDGGGGGAGFGGGFGPNGDNAQAQKIDQWVRANGAAVDPSLWRVPEPLRPYGQVQAGGPGSGQGFSRGNALQLFDLSAGPAKEGAGAERIGLAKLSWRRHRHRLQ